jgi:hypothetical protein
MASTQLSNPLGGLVGSKTKSLRPVAFSVAISLTQGTGCSELGQHMDIGLLAGIAMLIVWAIGTFVYEAPGWIHLLLSVGVFIVIYRIVVRGTPGVDTTTKKQ